MSPHYALYQKIPGARQPVHNRDDKVYDHWNVLAIFPTIEAAREGKKIWRWSFGYDGDTLETLEVPGWVQTGRIYALREIAEIKRDITGPIWADSSGGKTGPGPALGSLRNVKAAPDMGTGAKVTKEGSSLIAGDYEIVPEKSLITVYSRTRDDDGAPIRGPIMAKVDGYPGRTGITRARREVQYLIDEPEAHQDRIDSGLYPVITPGTIVLYRAVRPELALVTEGVPA